MTQQEVWLRLSTVKRLDAFLACHIVTGLFKQGNYDAGYLRVSGLTEKQISAYSSADPLFLDVTLHWLEQHNHHLVAFNHDSYPLLLKQISSPPLVLFVEGQLSLLTTPQIAIVGSRSYSHYGEHWARYFTAGLVGCGFTITSGLAIGIDGICHQSALDSEGKTIAVLGSGLMHIHPRKHQYLARQIIEQGGVLISELPVTAPALPQHFPRRNRIISGMSAGVLIVEASLRSGSLITARFALEQGREVFALPGPIGSPTSEGAHWLIKQGAYLVTDPNDIAEHIGSGLTWLPVQSLSTLNQSNLDCVKAISEENIFSEEDQVELPFADVLANVEYEVTPVDVVAERAGQSVPEVVVKLLELELAGWIAAVSGGYVRIRRAGHVRRTNVFI